MRHFPRRKVAVSLAVSGLPSSVQPPRTELGAITRACALKGFAPLYQRASAAEPLTAITPPAKSQLYPATIA